MTEQRFKEIGIRKVLGASAFRLMNMLSKDFMRLVFIAFLIATPMAWYLIDRWLQEFVFHINIQWWMFVLAGVAVLSVALFTVSDQTLRAVSANPIESLNQE